jgi:hypothetical protein
MQGVYLDEIEGLDSHSPAWRRTYFLRNIVRTLMEIDSAIHGLRSNAEFVTLLEAQPTQVQEQFGRLFKAMEEAHNIVKHTRNTICGHVKHSAVQQALEGMDHARWGFLDVGRTLKETHYKFAAEIAIEMLLIGVSEKEREEILQSQLIKIAELFPAFALTDHILSMYIQSRKLA